MSPSDQRPQLIIRWLDRRWQAEVPARDRPLRARTLHQLRTDLRQVTDMDDTVLVFRTGDAQRDQLIHALQAASAR